jgi:hypothetical protein
MPRKIFFLFLSISLLIAAALTAGEFTADLSITGPQVDTKAKISVKGNLYRLDAPQGESPIALIYNKGASWMINPELKQFRELSQAEEAFMNPFAAWENMSHDMIAEMVGTETIKGSRDSNVRSTITNIKARPKSCWKDGWPMISNLSSNRFFMPTMATL